MLNKSGWRRRKDGEKGCPMRTGTRSQATAAPLRRRALDALRPGVEAVLLATVALGCAQAGWSVIAPSSAGATAPRTDESDATTRIASRDVRSPFAPQAIEGSNAANALLSTLRLSGVRVGVDETLSSAYLSLDGGGERAFLVGDPIRDGVVLEEVRADRIFVSHNGTRSEILLAQAPRTETSYALALMGRLPQPDAPQPGAHDNGSPSIAMGAMATPFALASMGAAEQRDGRVVGWRVSESMPESARAAGLQAGDVVTAVNGVGADQPAALMNAARSGGPVMLSVERGGASITLSVTPDPRT